MDIMKRIQRCGIIPVIKLNTPEEAVPLCNALYAGGIDVAEITFRSDAAKEGIAHVCSELPGVLAGAGTVTNLDQAKAAADAGAKFIVTPGFSKAIVGYCIDNGLPVVPGCSSPTDMQALLESGLLVAKFFPAESLGGLSTLKAISAPYHMLKFIPTGGINAQNIGQYLRYEKVLACGGSWMVPNPLVQEQRYGEITALSAQAVASLHGFSISRIVLHAQEEQKAHTARGLLASLFPQPAASLNACPIEVSNSPAQSQIHIRCNQIERALAYLQDKGVGVRADGIEGDAGSVVLDAELCGFSLCLSGAS
ncbi:MAG: bifunctional 4-hydroxy-2-oxoglutarate aldolase/2-dehydro-3-deoxy-phosphogluconate aldolase [Christensenellales bacterium]|jgi:2-dehydro-3-deoxyphosphogluconate aldolase/(4S)-4-hydroxy-2-oxoglutarate aldolase